MHPEDVLKVIPDKELPALRDLLKFEWPQHIHAYFFIENAYKWKIKHPDEEFITFYCPGGDWSDGTFIAIIKINCYEVFVYTLDKMAQRLQDALRNTSLIQWKDKPVYPAVRDDVFDKVARIQKEHGVTMAFNVPSNVWWMPKEQAIQFECSVPSELYLDALKSCHVDTINEAWPHRYPGSHEYITKLLELNHGIGVFSRETGELCAWVMKNFFHALGLLQTSEKYKRKGYATVVTRILSKMIAEEGYDVMCFVVRVNTPSRRLFASLGFQEITGVTWMK